jgi:hypothetical protein
MACHSTTRDDLLGMHTPEAWRVPALALSDEPLSDNTEPISIENTLPIPELARALAISITNEAELLDEPTVIVQKAPPRDELPSLPSVRSWVLGLAREAKASLARRAGARVVAPSKEQRLERMRTAVCAFFALIALSNVVFVGIGAQHMPAAGKRPVSAELLNTLPAKPVARRTVAPGARSVLPSPQKRVPGPRLVPPVMRVAAATLAIRKSRGGPTDDREPHRHESEQDREAW